MKKSILVVAFLTAVSAFGQEANLPSCRITTPSGGFITVFGLVTYVYDTATGKDAGGTLAPGQRVTLVGNSFTYSTDSIPAVGAMTNGSFSTSLAGTQVWVNGELAPVLSIGLGGPLPFAWTLQTQVPWDLDLSKPPVIQTQLTRPDGSQCLGLINLASLNATAVTPAFYLSADGAIITQNDGNGYLTFYMNGLGKPAAPVTTGTLTVAAVPLDYNTSVQVLVDGNSVAVTYAGLTPGALGVFQMNVYAPIGPGNHSLDVIVGGKKTSGQFVTQ